MGNPLHGRFRGLLLCGMLATCSFGQGKVSDFINTKSWTGTVSIKGSGSGSTSGGGYEDTWSFSIDSEITVTLDTFVPNIQGWTGTFKGTGKIVAEDKAAIPRATAIAREAAATAKRRCW